MTALEKVDQGIKDLQARRAEHDGKRAQAEAELAQLKAEWATLCKRSDVDGEKGLGAEIGANEAAQATAARTIERAGLAVAELQARLEAAQGERVRILVEDRRAELAKLDAQDVAMAQKFIDAARAFVAASAACDTHVAAKARLVSEVTEVARSVGLPELRVRRLPLFPLDPSDTPGPDGTLERFLLHDVFPRWPGLK